MSTIEIKPTKEQSEFLKILLAANPNMRRFYLSKHVDARLYETATRPEWRFFTKQFARRTRGPSQKRKQPTSKAN